MVTDTTTTIEGSTPLKRAIRRPKSKTPYPWFDLDAMLAIANRVAESGGGSLSSATLARLLGIALGSGAWRLRMTAARLFGLLSEEHDSVTLTERARRILEATPGAVRAQALAEAFRSVPLFRGVMEELGEGRPLPQPEGLDDMLKHKFGIVDNRLREAREILLASARQADVLEERGGRLYLVMPRLVEASQDGDEGSRTEPASASESSVGEAKATRRRTTLELQLTDEDLDSLEEEEIKGIYKAVADFEILRRRARLKAQQAKASTAS